MSPRFRRLLLLFALVAGTWGCAHRSGEALAPASVARKMEAANGPSRDAKQARGSFTRLDAAKPFDPRLIVTTQVAHGDLFLHAFGPTGPRYVSASRVHRGQQAYFLPFAANYGVSADRRSDVTYELGIRRPDGLLDGPVLESVLWRGAVASPGLVLYPATTVIFQADEDDPVGDYLVTARVTDHLAGETRELTHIFTVVDYHPASLPVEFDARAWFLAYYQQPAPELALAALPALHYGRTMEERTAELPALLGFYDQILTDNAWLLPAFCARLAAAEPDEAYVLSLVLGHHLRAAAEPPAGVDFAAWVRLEDFRGYAWPADAEAPLARTAQLDALWGRFFASGLYAPLSGILAALAHHADLGAADRWQEARAAAGQPADLSPAALADAEEGASEAPPLEVRRDVLLRNALWSLRGNARRHTLVRSYLDWNLRLGELPAPQAALLQHILAPETATADTAQATKR